MTTQETAVREWLTKAVQMAEMQYRASIAPAGASCAHDAPTPSAWQWLADNARAVLAPATPPRP